MYIKNLEWMESLSLVGSVEISELACGKPVLVEPKGIKIVNHLAEGQMRIAGIAIEMQGREIARSLDTGVASFPGVEAGVYVNIFSNDQSEYLGLNETRATQDGRIIHRIVVNVEPILSNIMRDLGVNRGNLQGRLTGQLNKILMHEIGHAQDAQHFSQSSTLEIAAGEISDKLLSLGYRRKDVNDFLDSTTGRQVVFDRYLRLPPEIVARKAEDDSPKYIQVTYISDDIRRQLPSASPSDYEDLGAHRRKGWLGRLLGR